MNPFLPQDQSPRLKEKLQMTLPSRLLSLPTPQPNKQCQLSAGSGKDPRLQGSSQGGWLESEFPNTQAGNRDAWSPLHPLTPQIQAQPGGESGVFSSVSPPAPLAA